MPAAHKRADHPVPTGLIRERHTRQSPARLDRGSPTVWAPFSASGVRYNACRLTPSTRATLANGYPSATRRLSSFSRHEQKSASEIACSRQTSLTLQSPRSPASTTSIFCCAEQLRFFLCSLNPIFSSGRATHAEPDAGHPLRRYAPPGPSDHPTQLAVNTPTGSRATEPLRATLEWVDWYNHRRLLRDLGLVQPAEHETTYYAQHPSTTTAKTQTKQPA